jgi:hypothetical protein
VPHSGGASINLCLVQILAIRSIYEYMKSHETIFFSMQDLPLLHPRSHDGFLEMQYDDSYTPFLQRAGLDVISFSGSLWVAHVQLSDIDCAG